MMTDIQPEIRSCELSLHLFRHGRAQATYDKEQGLKRRLVFWGYVSDYDEPPSIFDGKRVRVEVFSPPDPKWLGGISKGLHANNVCGVISVKAGVEPEYFEAEWDSYEEDEEANEDDAPSMIQVEPVSVALGVGPDAFEVIHSHAASARESCRIMGLGLTLIGSTLPRPRSRL